MESWLGPRFAGVRRSFFPNGWRSKFWIFHGVWFAAAKNLERRHRSVFSILANKLRLVDSFGADASGLGRLAYLESRVALGEQTSSGCSLCLARCCDLRVGLLFQNRAMGMGQSQAHGLGLLSHSAFSVERHHRALRLSGTGGDLHCVARLGIYNLPRGIVCRAPRLRTHRARETRLPWRTDS